MEIKKINLLNKKGIEKQMSIGSGCVIIQQGKILLVRGKGGSEFKFPGGHIMDSENFKETAQRETKEEINCEVEIIGDPIFYLFKLNEKIDIILIHYLANIISGEPQPTTEIEEIRWFDVTNLPENIFDNVKIVLNEINKDNI